MEEGRKVAENRHINHTRKYMRHSAYNCYAEDVNLKLSRGIEREEESAWNYEYREMGYR